MAKSGRVDLCTLAATLCLSGSVLAISAVASAQADEERIAAYPRVRAYDSHAAELITDGYVRSATFRALVEALNGTDVIVHVLLGSSRWHSAGYVQFAAATAGARHLRVVVTSQGGRLWSIATIAHELQHALEVAAAQEVRDSASFYRLYERIGERQGEHRFDTRAAREITDRVWRELHDSKEDVGEPPSPELVAAPP